MDDTIYKFDTYFMGDTIFDRKARMLGNITIKSTKLKKVGKNALREIKANAKIKVSAKKLSEYQKRKRLRL